MGGGGESRGSFFLTNLRRAPLPSPRPAADRARAGIGGFVAGLCPTRPPSRALVLLPVPVQALLLAAMLHHHPLLQPEAAGALKHAWDAAGGSGAAPPAPSPLFVNAWAKLKQVLCGRECFGCLCECVTVCVTVCV